MATKAFRNQQKSKFLKKFKEIKTIYTTCEAVGLPRRTVYQWLKDDPDFKADFDEIRLGIGDNLESVAFRLIEKMEADQEYGKPLLLITMLNANNAKYKSTDSSSEESKQLMEDFRKMAAEKKVKVEKSKAVKEAEDIINDPDTE